MAHKVSCAQCGVSEICLPFGLNVEEIARRFSVDLKGVPCIGDSLRDLQAAAAVGAAPILVLTGKGERTRQAGELPEGTQVYPDLAAAARAIAK